MQWFRVMEDGYSCWQRCALSWCIIFLSTPLFLVVYLFIVYIYVMIIILLLAEHSFTQTVWWMISYFKSKTTNYYSNLILTSFINPPPSKQHVTCRIILHLVLANDTSLAVFKCILEITFQCLIYRFIYLKRLPMNAQWFIKKTAIYHFKQMPRNRNNVSSWNTTLVLQ